MRVLLRDMVKRYGDHVVVKGITLDIADGEFFTLLGPSGCGKTTLLRLLAGFADPDGGEIYFGETPMSKTPPHKRGTGMVFQSYALFPQLNVFENVAYGLRARKAPAGEIKEKVLAALESVQLEAFRDRFPSQLSGGQQQRVALARALVIRPGVLLMDEPLSNLDAKLRVSMRETIRAIQKRRKITTIYVTHDQEEAMAVSDRIAILNAGEVQQVGAPQDIYFSPVNRFTAEFMGSCNLIEMTGVSFEEGRGAIRGQTGGVTLMAKSAARPQDGAATIMVRPDWFRLTDLNHAPHGVNAFEGTVVESTFLGATVTYQVQALGGLTLRVDVPDPGRAGIRAEGERVCLSFDPERAVAV